MTTVKVCFSIPEEFLEEADKLLADKAKDARANEPDIARVTQTWEASGISPSIHRVSLLAGIMAQRSGYAELAELRTYIGDDWGRGSGGDTIEKANKEVEKLTEKLKGLGYDVRAGRFQVNGAEA